MEEEKILDNITKSISSRLKVPIIITYVSVLVIYNWDILFYLFFENISASSKIKIIKENFSEIYYERILISLIIAVFLILIFTILNTILNFCLKWFYRKDKEINSQINDYEKVSLLTRQLSDSIENSNKLESQIAHLEKINQNLSTKKIDIKVSAISKKDYDNFLTYANSLLNKEKFLFSFKELMNILRKDKNIETDDILKSASYEYDMKQLLKHLEDTNLVKGKSSYNHNKQTNTTRLDFSISFKDFFNMEL